MDTQQRNRLIFTVLNLIAIVGMIYWSTRVASVSAPKEVTFSEFLTELHSGNLAEVQITERQLLGKLKESPQAKQGQVQTIKATRLPGVDESALLKELQDHPTKFSGHIDQSPWILSLIGWLLPLLVIG